MASLITRVKNRIIRHYFDLTDKFPFVPKDFSWKTRWRMRNDRNPMFVVVQDKYRAREFANQRGVQTAELYYDTDVPETIPFDKLPPNYFVKANHGCKWNILCNNGLFYFYGDGEDLIGRKNFDAHKITREQVVEYCKEWLRTRYSKREWAYQKIEPKIVVEEVLEQRGGGELIDYRCFTFRGVVKAIYVDSPTNSIHQFRQFVDADWNEFPLKNLKEDVPHHLPEKPETFHQMIRAAEILGRDFDFLRVDHFDTSQGVRLGEMSLYHNGGEPMQPTPDRDFNQWLGDQWVLPDTLISE